MGDIATHAGISRVWLYRHFDNRDALVGRLLLREAQRFIAGFLAFNEPERPTAEVAVDAFVYVVGFLREHPLVQRMLEKDTEVSMQYLSTGITPVLNLVISAATTHLVERTAMPEREARAVMETIARLIYSIIASSDVATNFNDPDELRGFAEMILPRLLT